MCFRLRWLSPTLRRSLLRLRIFIIPVPKLLNSFLTWPPNFVYAFCLTFCLKDLDFLRVEDDIFPSYSGDGTRSFTSLYGNDEESSFAWYPGGGAWGFWSLYGVNGKVIWTVFNMNAFTYSLHFTYLIRSWNGSSRVLKDVLNRLSASWSKSHRTNLVRMEALNDYYFKGSWVYSFILTSKLLLHLPTANNFPNLFRFYLFPCYNRKTLSNPPKFHEIGLRLSHVWSEKFPAW